MLKNPTYNMNVFFEFFSKDSTKLLLPNFPYYDRYQNPLLIDLAVVSKSRRDRKKIAILIQPEEYQRIPLQQKRLELAVNTLVQQEWIPVIFSPNELETRHKYVKQKLHEALHGFVPSVRRNKKRKLNHLSWAFRLCSELSDWKHVKVGFTAFVIIAGVIGISLSLYHTKASELNLAKSFNDYNKNQTEEYFYLENTSRGNTEKNWEEVVEKNRLNPTRQRKIVPVINLDDNKREISRYSSFNRNHAANSEQPHSLLEKPLYLATVRYCSNGITCVLRNGSTVTLWGIALPKDPGTHSKAMQKLNTLVAGRQVTLKMMKYTPEIQFVKLSLKGKDISQYLIAKQYLRPAGELQTKIQLASNE